MVKERCPFYSNPYAKCQLTKEVCERCYDYLIGELSDFENCYLYQVATETITTITLVEA
jgi:hypothetical protein